MCVCARVRVYFGAGRWTGCHLEIFQGFLKGWVDCARGGCLLPFKLVVSTTNRFPHCFSTPGGNDPRLLKSSLNYGVQKRAGARVGDQSRSKHKSWSNSKGSSKSKKKSRRGSRNNSKSWSRSKNKTPPKGR